MLWLWWRSGVEAFASNSTMVSALKPALGVTETCGILWRGASFQVWIKDTTMNLSQYYATGMFCPNSRRILVLRRLFCRWNSKLVFLFQFYKFVLFKNFNFLYKKFRVGPSPSQENPGYKNAYKQIYIYLLCKLDSVLLTLLGQQFLKIQF